MLPRRFIVKNVDLWNSNGLASGQDVLVEDGVFKDSWSTQDAEGVKRRAEFEDSQIFEGNGKVLLPAGVDNQVHLRVPGQLQKETPESGLRAALRGGYLAVLTMPNTQPVLDSVESLELARELLKPAQETTGVEVYFSAAMTKGQQGREVVDAAVLADWGVKALTDDGKGVASDEVMLAVMREAEVHALPVLQHAEVPGHGGVLAPGPTQKKDGVPAYSDEAEWKMVERDIALLEKHCPELRYHVLHVSARKTLELVEKAREKQLFVTAEVTPHHLFFSSEDIPSGVTSFKMNPPLRSPEDRTALRRALAAGTLAFVATDHAPHEATQKGDNFKASAFGTTGLETSLRVLLSLVKAGDLSPERLVQVFSTAPAQFLGLQDQYGRLQKGFPFRAVLLDPDAPAEPLKVEELESLSKNNCFLGTPLPGRVEAVFSPTGLHRFWA